VGVVSDHPILTSWLHDSYETNVTVRAAGSQILRPQIARHIAASELLPQAQTAILGYSRTMASRTGGTPIGPGPTFGVGLTPGPVLSPVGTPAAPVAAGTPLSTGAATSPVNPGISGVAVPGGGRGRPGPFFCNNPHAVHRSRGLH